MASSKQQPEGRHPEVGEQLREAAERMGITIAEMGERAHISKQAAYRAIRGENITLDTLLALAHVVGLRQIRLGFTNIDIDPGHLESARLRDALDEVKRFGDFIEELADEAERREEGARLVSGIAGDARARLRKTAATAKRRDDQH